MDLLLDSLCANLPRKEGLDRLSYRMTGNGQFDVR